MQSEQRPCKKKLDEKFCVRKRDDKKKIVYDYVKSFCLVQTVPGMGSCQTMAFDQNRWNYEKVGT